jgi:hypothetical protein
MQKRQEVLKRLAARSLRTNSFCTVAGGVLSFSEIVMNIRPGRVNVCFSEPLGCLRGILARHHESDDVQVAKFSFASGPGCPEAGRVVVTNSRPARPSGPERISTAVIFHDAVYLLPVPLHGRHSNTGNAE